ncbi:hypothetical protein ACGXRE_000001, partial [Escherichia coli]
FFYVYIINADIIFVISVVKRHEVYHPSLNRSILAVVDETNKALHWIARLCSSLECDMFL